METIRFYNNELTIILNESNKKRIHKHVRETWGVNPETQLKIEDSKLYLTNKTGETFAQIGEIIHL